jgi:hypothetical protein
LTLAKGSIAQVVLTFDVEEFFEDLLVFDELHLDHLIDQLLDLIQYKFFEVDLFVLICWYVQGEL